MNETLPDDISARVKSLCADGDTLAKQGQPREAFQKYSEALSLLPDPAEDWEAATWILAAIGDLYFGVQKFDKARTAFTDAVMCPGGLGNPFIHLRLGQCQFELGEMERAADELARAYMGAGADLFKSEEPRYLDFLKQKILI
jgi:tetratricopeptide (TPR) repeat protein